MDEQQVEQTNEGLFGEPLPIGTPAERKRSGVRLIVGLGNPGKQYHPTRHNVGFRTLDALARRVSASAEKKAFGGLLASATVGGVKLLLLKPQQYMNRSGQVVADAVNFYKVPLDDVMVALDDMALPVGQLRFRAKGSAGGHNGLKDVIARLGSDAFARLRIGIGQAGAQDAAAYVLAAFSPAENEQIEKAIETAVEGLLCWATDGIDAAMNRFNSRPTVGDEPNAAGGKNDKP